MRTKNPKACEPCRRRKIKCDGNLPCTHCRSEPSACSYRLKARNRRPSRYLGENSRPDSGSGLVSSQQRDTHRALELVQEHSPSRSATADPIETSIQDPSPRLYESVAVTHRAPRLNDSSQLFYGPSSSFAFIQQIHQIIQSKATSPEGNPDANQSQDEAGLDVFKKRDVFFGVPLRADPLARPLDESRDISVLIAKPLAASLLAEFQAGSYSFFPFTSLSAHSNILDEAYNDTVALSPLKKAYLLLMLAIGALQFTSHAELADQMFIEAKREAVAYEDVVTISTIQIPLLMAHYQINMGRLSSAYLYVGSACRKGMALGLAHITTGHTYEQTQERSATLWSLYYHEIWLAMMAGRRSMIREEDVGWPYPNGQRLLGNLCRAGAIMEDISASLYNQRTSTLGNLHEKAQALHDRLRQWGQSLGIGSLSSSRQETSSDLMITLTLHNVYFYLVHAIFRPFLITEFALQQSGHRIEAGELWLRQACRNATDAAVDSIVFMDSMRGKIDFAKVRRQDSFFVEASCIILLFDSLRHPSKHANNIIYINMALACLRAMVQDEPITSVALSICRILNSVQDKIACKHVPTTNATCESLQANIQLGIQDPTLDSSDPILYYDPDSGSLNGRQARPDHESFANGFLPPPGIQSFSMSQSSPHFDLLTIDLSNYFPLEMDSDTES